MSLRCQGRPQFGRTRAALRTYPANSVGPNFGRFLSEIGGTRWPNLVPADFSRHRPSLVTHRPKSGQIWPEFDPLLDKLQPVSDNFGPDSAECRPTSTKQRSPSSRLGSESAKLGSSLTEFGRSWSQVNASLAKCGRSWRRNQMHSGTLVEQLGVSLGGPLQGVSLWEVEDGSRGDSGPLSRGWRSVFSQSSETRTARGGGRFGPLRRGV